MQRLMFQKWECEYYLDRCLETFNQRWCNIPPSATYSYTITTHPSKNHHPLWKEATKTKVEEEELGHKIKLPLYHQCMTSAALQLAVNHTFMGFYAKRFCPSDPLKPSSAHVEVCSNHHPTLSPHSPSTIITELTWAFILLTAHTPYKFCSPLIMEPINYYPLYKQVALPSVPWILVQIP